MKEKICLIICLLIAFLVAGCSQTQDEQDFQSAEDVVQKVHEEYDSIKGVSGTVIIEYSAAPNGTVGKTTEEHQFWMDKNDLYKYRIEYEDGITGSNGSVTWINAHGSIILISQTFSDVYKSEEDYGVIFDYAPKEDLYWWLNSTALMPEERTMNLTGEEEVADRECYVIEVYEEVNHTKEPFSKLWIDKEYYYPLKISEIDTGYNFTYENIKFNPGIEDSEFEYKLTEETEAICYCKNRSDFHRWNCSCEELGG